MGGFGSGRHNWDHRKVTVEECLTLDINQLRRAGCLKDGEHFFSLGDRYFALEAQFFPSIDIGTLNFYYHFVTRTGRREVVHNQIAVTPTPTNFGGRRWWFRCPNAKKHVTPCDRRAAKLYLAPGYRDFGCRDCHDLTYQSCRDSGRLDAAEHVGRLRAAVSVLKS